PNTGSVWAIEALLFQNKRINTFVREDWLNKLGLDKPTNLEEFEDMLRAFRDNAELLLGADADKMIPYSTSFDVGWRNDHLLTSFVPEGISDRETYVFGFDDRRLLYPGYKEGVRRLNQWYNEGLVWKDFPLYGAGDTTEDNMMKAGYVGAFMHNWDYPYRDGQEGIHANLQKLVGEDAAFIAVEAFKNDAGIYRKYLSAPVDRKVFFPSTNTEPLASLLYLNWLANIENRRFLQIGEEGVNHMVTESGAIKSLPVTGEKIMNSPQNIDYTIVINGLDLGDPALTSKSIALNYAGVDARFIEPAYIITSNQARYGKNVQVGEIRAEEGMGTVLSEKRNNLLAQAVVAKVEDFDQVWDRGFTDYLRSGGQAIINERAQKYDAAY
ncbi:MAG TPA: sugar ABC transporter substrate-binding protein, partial [Firmicutes bacterium]|nr:sugar ABC transporter substrate-binding protein [Bacillota bacterium]